VQYGHGATKEKEEKWQMGTFNTLLDGHYLTKSLQYWRGWFKDGTTTFKICGEMELSTMYYDNGKAY